VAGLVEEVAANAVLIAAAPEMLEALEEAHRALTGCDTDSVGAAIFLQIDAVLAKATGLAARKEGGPNVG
jgi:hypothetical protein